MGVCGVSREWEVVWEVRVGAGKSMFAKWVWASTLVRWSTALWPTRSRSEASRAETRVHVLVSYEVVTVRVNVFMKRNGCSRATADLRDLGRPQDIRQEFLLQPYYYAARTLARAGNNLRAVCYTDGGGRIRIASHRITFVWKRVKTSGDK